MGFPEERKIYKGKVKKIEAFGAFIEIPPYRSNGLVHKTQCSTMRIENVEDVLDLGQEVFVKVLKVEMQESQGGGGPPRAKISLSIKWVSQTDGSDKDPEGIEQEAEERRRRPKDGASAVIPGGQGMPGASGLCSKCGQRGHLATECFTRAGQNYELVPALDEGVTTKLLPPSATGVSREDEKERKEAKKAKKQAKRERKKAKKAAKKAAKKDKKAKKHKKERRRESSSSRSSSSSGGGSSRTSSQSGSDSGSDDERGPRPAPPPAPSGPPFIPSAAFSGKKAGYVFKNGPSGLGYYLDSV